MSDLIDRDYMLSQIEKAKAENRPFDYDSLIDFVKVLPNANKAELEEIKAEIIKGKCKYCDIDSNIQKCHEEHIIGWCDVYDILFIIDNHITELKGENK